MSEILNDEMGIREIWHPDIHAGEQNIIETVQDCEPITEINKRIYNQFDERTPFKGDGFHRVASIPLVIFMDLEKKGITKDSKAFARWLDAPEHAAFRTRPGKLSR